MAILKGQAPNLKEEDVWQLVKDLAKAGETHRLMPLIERVEQELLVESYAFETLLNVALTSSISSNKDQTALALLDYGANPSLYDSLALRTSASQGLYEVAIKCMEKGADPCIAQGMILHLAASHGQPNIVRAILDFTKSKKIPIRELKPQRAIEIANFEKRVDMATIIFSYMENDDVLKCMNSLYNKEIRQCAKDILIKRDKEKLKPHLKEDATIVF